MSKKELLARIEGLEQKVGVETSTGRGYAFMMDRFFRDCLTDYKPKSLTKKIEELSDKIDQLEKFLNIKHVTEKKEFTGYKKNTKK